jgi:vacuolar-type H+-ATPase subunit I/STV1
MFGGDDENLSSDLNNNNTIKTLLAKHRDEKPEPLDRPSTYNDIMAAMESNLKKAIEVAELLQNELTQTKSRVVDLEVEVKKREEEITQIQEYKVEMNNFMKEKRDKTDGDEKTLSLTDSVMVGDSIMGGVKIDKQINNDPEAIARAVIEAYRSGLND